MSEVTRAVAQACPGEGDAEQRSERTGIVRERRSVGGNARPGRISDREIVR